MYFSDARNAHESPARYPYELLVTRHAPAEEQTRRYAASIPADDSPQDCRSAEFTISIAQPRAGHSHPGVAPLGCCPVRSNLPPATFEKLSRPTERVNFHAWCRPGAGYLPVSREEKCRYGVCTADGWAMPRSRPAWTRGRYARRSGARRVVKSAGNGSRARGHGRRSSGSSIRGRRIVPIGSNCILKTPSYVLDHFPDWVFAFDEFGPLGIRPTAGSGGISRRTP
ncbi:hypothetical protein GCM10010145_59380 [Streptomyces ruber]|uniref:Uncharacterized protein n=2 Tax=Streptomyces TaxID=1883 RepID=A0A918EXE5_9ACTN|nr:hypothetical protein GCM10010145_59380 [Streptomyces ruber]